MYHLGLKSKNMEYMWEMLWKTTSIKQVCCHCFRSSYLSWPAEVSSSIPRGQILCLRFSCTSPWLVFNRYPRRNLLVVTHVCAIAQTLRINLLLLKKKLLQEISFTLKHNEFTWNYSVSEFAYCWISICIQHKKLANKRYLLSIKIWPAFFSKYDK